jgi:hypothetical protein
MKIECMNGFCNGKLKDMKVNIFNNRVRFTCKKCGTDVSYNKELLDKEGVRYQ